MAAEQAIPVARPRSVGQTTGLFSSRKTRQTIEVWAIRLVLIVICAATLLPTLYVVLYSLKGGGPSLYSRTLIPEVLTFDNYRQLLEGSFPRWVGNSLILGLTSGFLAVLFSTFAGYAFSRMRFPGRRHGILVLLVVQMLPANMALVAYFKLLREVNLLNTRTGLILIFGFGGSALAVWLMKNFMDSIPRDLDEAASLDGANHWRTFWTVIFPLVQPMLVAQFIFGFIGVYNEYLLTTVLLSDPDKYPLGVGVRTFSEQFNTNWTQFCAAAVLGSAPILFIFFLAQRLLVEGLTKGAVKG
ncbi:MAG: arabinogalactan oligomer / maltooligosaccharide transport system permease protein [Thermomicrobiales bacterium]|jgi:arabinogalactan oligomer/maltooligosaccharide transport system permease protein|nr:arabinogalactan oligomer / maltooligosaccharide transport system permease protein [Thermomicrobiales bacterium]MEA2527613.1 arabinogalactan oligomer / maltooligosaccharide transport system permease protein [Thermomicrobiales bacterium]MEA2595570.1 arabinogalactan oligomer / maltooligosaccharide transport system permease protein [Thermomicrobiales bacterium]